MSAFLPASVSARNREGFTLIEILVAIVIMTLIVATMAQIFSATSTAISENSKNMNSLDAAEAVLQQVGLDVSRMILRDDFDYSFVKNTAGAAGNLPGNDAISFYARNAGLSTSGAPFTDAQRPLSVVSYQIQQNATTHLLELDYGALQIDWDNAGSTPLVFTAGPQLLTTPNTLPTVSSLATLAPEVVRLEISFVLKNDPVQTNNPPKLLTSTVPAYISATNVPFPIENVAGIVVGIVIIDPKSRQLLPAGVDLKIAQLFPDAVANQDLLSLWTPLNTEAKLEAIGVPKKAVAGVRIYEKYFPFPW